MKVWVIRRGEAYSGSGVSSIHATLDGALKRAHEFIAKSPLAEFTPCEDEPNTWWCSVEEYQVED